jgi:hypothetical protein
MARGRARFRSRLDGRGSPTPSGTGPSRDRDPTASAASRDRVPPCRDPPQTATGAAGPRAARPLSRFAAGAAATAGRSHRRHDVGPHRHRPGGHGSLRADAELRADGVRLIDQSRAVRCARALGARPALGGDRPPPRRRSSDGAVRDRTPPAPPGSASSGESLAEPHQRPSTGHQVGSNRASWPRTLCARPPARHGATLLTPPWPGTLFARPSGCRLVLSRSPGQARQNETAFRGRGTDRRAAGLAPRRVSPAAAGGAARGWRCRRRGRPAPRDARGPRRPRTTTWRPRRPPPPRPS